MLSNAQFEIYKKISQKYKEYEDKQRAAKVDSYDWWEALHKSTVLRDLAIDLLDEDFLSSPMK